MGGVRAGSPVHYNFFLENAKNRLGGGYTGDSSGIGGKPKKPLSGEKHKIRNRDPNKKIFKTPFTKDSQAYPPENRLSTPSRRKDTIIPPSPDSGDPPAPVDGCLYGKF